MNILLNQAIENDRFRECDDWRYKLLGRVILDDNEKSSLTDDEFVRKKDLPKPNRIIAPNSIISSDYKPDRLNINVDHTMRVTAVHYG